MGSLTAPPAEISPNSVQWPSHFYSEARLLADKQLLLRGHPIEVLKMCKKCHWTLLLESTTVHCLRHHRHITLSASWCHQAATLVGKRCMTCIISVLWELLAANLSQTPKSNLFKSVAGQTFTIRTMFLQDVTIPLQVQNRCLALTSLEERSQGSKPQHLIPCETTSPNSTQDVLSSCCLPRLHPPGVQAAKSSRVAPSKATWQAMPLATSMGTISSPQHPPSIAKSQCFWTNNC